MDNLSQMILLGAAGAGGGSYWLSTLSNASLRDQGTSISLDSTGNIYVAGGNNASNTRPFVAKYDTDGALLWQKHFSGVNGSPESISAALDSSANIYLVSLQNNIMLVAKVNSSGTLQWQRNIGTADDQPRSVAVDSSGNVYGVGFCTTGASGASDMQLFKYNTSGTLQWQRKLGSTDRDIAFDAAISSAGNLCIAGRRGDSSTVFYPATVQYDSSGNLSWSRRLVADPAGIAYGVTTDSSNNVYSAGYVRNSSFINGFLLTKFNSSGTFQWSNVIRHTSATFHLECYGVTRSASGFIYAIGTERNNSTGARKAFIAKYSESTGNVVWQRTLVVKGYDEGFDIKVDANEDMYLTGYGGTSSTQTTFDVWTAKLPGDGSLTGTYGGIVYSSVSYTQSTNATSSDTTGFTSSTSTLNTATPSNTWDNASMTETLTPI